MPAERLVPLWQHVEHCIRVVVVRAPLLDAPLVKAAPMDTVAHRQAECAVAAHLVVDQGAATVSTLCKSAGAPARSAAHRALQCFPCDPGCDVEVRELATAPAAFVVLHARVLWVTGHLVTLCAV